MIVKFYEERIHKKCLEPIPEVLQKMESDESQSMSFIYNDMHRAKLAIKAIHGDVAQKYEPFWSVIDNHWNSVFLHPLWYRPDFIMYPEVILGLNECIVQQESDNGKRIAAFMQIPDFVSSKADFGMDLAISTRIELDPGTRRQGSSSVTNTRVVRTGVPRAQGGRGNAALIRVPFLFIILGTVALGGLNATRAYKKEKATYPSHNPFLP